MTRPSRIAWRVMRIRFAPYAVEGKPTDMGREILPRACLRAVARWARANALPRRWEGLRRGSKESTGYAHLASRYCRAAKWDASRSWRFRCVPRRYLSETAPTPDIDARAARVLALKVFTPRAPHRRARPALLARAALDQDRRKCRHTFSDVSLGCRVGVVVTWADAGSS